jgi:hypothetical protein
MIATWLHCATSQILNTIAVLFRPNPTLSPSISPAAEQLSLSSLDIAMLMTP